MEVKCPFCQTSQEVHVARGEAVCEECGETFDIGAEEPTVLRDTEGAAEPPRVQRGRKETRAGGGKNVPEWLKEELGDRFEDIRLVGKGGMGAVFRAHQKKPARDVAIKAMLSPHLQSERLVRRFQREAQACAILDHPAIVPIYDYGEAAGHPYFVMEYVEGDSMTEWASRREPDRGEICRLMVRVCRALGYAHEQGVVHRDLKPSNILVNSRGEPRILDFGLARMAGRYGDAPTLTRSGDVVGTPHYMSPEQAAGETRKIDRRTDLYSLGVTFYELVVGVPPYDTLHAEGLQALDVLRNQEPNPPSKIHPSIPRDLEAILLKALEKDMSARYQRAETMADDIENFLEDKPVSARAHSRFYRLRKFLGRNRRTVLAAGVAAAVIITLVGWLGYISAGRGRQTARLRRMVDNMADVPAEVLGMARDGRWGRALTAARLAERQMSALGDTPRLLENVKVVIRREINAELQALSELIQRGEFKAAGERFRSLRGRAANLSVEALPDLPESYLALCWEEVKKKVESTYQKETAIGILESFFNGPAGKDDNLARTVELLLDSYRQRPPVFFAERGVETFRRACNRGRWTAARTVLESVRVSLEEAALADDETWTRRLRRMERRLSTAIRPGTVEGMTEQVTLRPEVGMVKAVTFSTDGSLLAAGGTEDAVRIWETDSWRRVQRIAVPETVRGLAFSPDGSVLAVGCQDGSVVFWNLEQGIRLDAGDIEMDGRITALDYGADGKNLAVGTVSRAAFWDVESGERVELMPGAAPRKLLDFCPTRPRVAALVEGGQVEVWDTELRRRITVLPTEGEITALHVGRGGKRVACANSDNQLLIYDTETGKLSENMGEGLDHVWSVQLSPDEALLASANSDTSVRLWAVRAGRQGGALRRHTKWVMCVSFSPHFRWLASGGNDKKVRIWGVDPNETD